MDAKTPKTFTEQYRAMENHRADPVIEAIRRGPGLGTTSDVRTHSKWPHLAALSIALGVPREQAFTCADATIRMQCVLANLDPDDRTPISNHESSANNWMLSKLSELFSNGYIETSWVGSVVVIMTRTLTSSSIYKNLPSIIESNVGTSARAIFEHALAELQKR